MLERSAKLSAIPGLTATLALALLLPLTYSLDVTTALMACASIYMAGMCGGSITATTTVTVNCITVASTDACSISNEITNLHADANPGEFHIKAQRRYENRPWGRARYWPSRRSSRRLFHQA